MGPKLDTALATTSGTTKDFSPPSWAKKITVMLNQVSTDGSENVVVQIGDSGGVETSGYVGATASVNTSAQGHANWSSEGGAALSVSPSASDVLSGVVVLALLDSSTNTWGISVNIGRSAGTVDANIGGGVKALSGSLTTVRLTSSGTPDDFDNGSVNCMYE